MSLPQWVEELAKESVQDDASLRLIQALGMAWEALAYYRDSADNTETADETMREIEELE